MYFSQNGYNILILIKSLPISSAYSAIYHFRHEIIGNSHCVKTYFMCTVGMHNMSCDTNVFSPYLQLHTNASRCGVLPNPIQNSLSSAIIRLIPYWGVINIRYSLTTCYEIDFPKMLQFEESHYLLFNTTHHLGEL